MSSVELSIVDGHEARDILVVDDNRANLLAIEAALGDLGHRLTAVTSGREALRLLLERDFAVILLDVQMPGLDGFETAATIRGRLRTRHVPIIFITAFNQHDEDILRGYSLGAVDFLFKPITREVLRAKLTAFVTMHDRAQRIREQSVRLHELERLQMERTLAAEKQRWEAELLREENRRKDDFLALLAHELRNPLAPLMTGLELVREYRIPHEGLGRTRASMERQVCRLTRIVDDLLDISRIANGKIALRIGPVSLTDVIREAVESVQHLIDERRHEIQLLPPAVDIRVLGDEGRLTQVFSNLFTNSARYTDPLGSIRVQWSRNGDEAVAIVADSGRGISSEMLEEIFERFVQEEGSQGGLGLGLTLVRTLVEMQGGSVAAHSPGKGRGSEFVVRLPLAPSDDTFIAKTSESGRVALVPEEHLSVVVVEDESDVRRALKELLEKWGHRVVTAADGESGIERILSNRPDVAIVDILIPRPDGYSVARRVRERLGQGIWLVAVTGFGRAEDLAKAIAAGFDEHVTKPATPADLRRILRRGHGAGD